MELRVMQFTPASYYPEVGNTAVKMERRYRLNLWVTAGSNQRALRKVILSLSMMTIPKIV
jgi:hypothetical protein